MRNSLSILGLVAALLSAGCQEAFSYNPGTMPNRPQEPSEGVQQNAKEYLVSSTAELSALKNLKAGDVVVWENGVYENVSIKFSGQGSEGQEILLKARTPGQVIFRGKSSLTLYGQFVAAEGFSFTDLDTSSKYSVLTCATGSSNCRFTNCRIDGSSSEVSAVDSKWVSLYGKQNEVSCCTFLDKRNMGCLFVVWMEDGIVPEHRILRNKFTRPYTHYDGNGSALNGQESIRIGTSTYSLNDAKCLVQGNWFYNCHGERAEIISNKACGNVYKDNLFEDSVGTLTLRHGNNCVVSGNIFVSSNQADVGGVRIIGEGHLVEKNAMLNLTGGAGYNAGICLVKGESNAALNGYWTVRNVTVSENVMVGCKNSVIINYGKRSTQDSCPEQVTFKDNVIISRSSSAVAVNVLDTPSGNLTWKNNKIFGGTCKGYEPEYESVEPQVEDYSSRIAKIKGEAGVIW